MTTVKNMLKPATGEQFRLTQGAADVVVASLAGALRSYTVGGTQLVETYPDDAVPPSAAGILLAPWPNRVAGGKWELDGQRQQLDISDPAHGNAIHGLLRNTGYTAVEKTADTLRLAAVIYPQHGYPFHLVHEVRYSLDADGGLRVRQSLTNLSSSRAPFALGAHPFLRLGEVPTEELALHIEAEVTLTTNESMIPTGQVPVSGVRDLRKPRKIGSLALDAAYTSLTERGGKYRHVLSADDGRTVQLWSDTAFGYVHVFVTDQFPGRTCAVALEPMTAPANALNSGEGLRWLEPSENFSAEWGIRADL